MAKNKDDKILETEEVVATGVEDTEVVITEGDNITDDAETTVDDSKAVAADTTDDEAANAVSDDSAAVVDDTADNSEEDDAKDTAEPEVVTPAPVAVGTRKVKSTNRIMKVYAHPSEKAKCHSFVGTYVVTGAVVGNFKQIVCNVPGIGKFTGYLLSR